MQQQDLTAPSSVQPGAAELGTYELELGDGSRLVLEDEAASPILCRIDGSQAERITLADAMSLSGQPFAGFRRLK